MHRTTSVRRHPNTAADDTSNKNKQPTQQQRPLVGHRGIGFEAALVRRGVLRLAAARLTNGESWAIREGAVGRGCWEGLMSGAAGKGGPWWLALWAFGYFWDGHRRMYGGRVTGFANDWGGWVWWVGMDGGWWVGVGCC